MNLGIDKIVFLDIDHVLTNTDIDNTSFLSYDPSKYKLSEVNLVNLDKVLDSTGASIVVTSNWRKFKQPDAAWLFDGKWYESPLESLKERYGSKIIDMLPAEHGLSKCECLELWFEDNPWFSKHGHYVILEDDLREGYQRHLVYSKHLIMTDRRFGLTKASADKAIAILDR